MKKLFAIVALASLGACISGNPPGHGSQVMNLPVVSTVTSEPFTGKGKSLGKVHGKFCTTDGSITERKGFIDESVAQALKSKGARYLYNASFRPDGSCIVVDGTAVK